MCITHGSCAMCKAHTIENVRWFSGRLGATHVKFTASDTFILSDQHNSEKRCRWHANSVAKRQSCFCTQHFVRVCWLCNLFLLELFSGVFSLTAVPMFRFA